MRYIIEKEKVKNNIDKVKKYIGDSHLIGVVKGNGYGLGIADYSRLLCESGVDFLATARFEEAVEIRNNGLSCKLLLMNPPHNDEVAKSCIDKNIVVTIDSTETAHRVNECAKTLDRKVIAHIILDTGFARFGFCENEIETIISLIKQCENIIFEGVYSHFYNPFIKDTSSVDKQAEKFTKIVSEIENTANLKLMKHMCSSVAMMRFPKYHFDAVRVGSALIGRVATQNNLELERVGYLECEIICVKDLQKGHAVGYGQIPKSLKAEKIAVVPFGFVDGCSAGRIDPELSFREKMFGILRKVKNIRNKQNISCTVGGKTVYVAGLVGMTDVILDVTNVDCKVSDVAIFEANPLVIDGLVKREYI